jgi:tryptophanyl-tRNA synthetase
MRERYEAFMADPAAIEAILRHGAQKARAIATPKIAVLRDALGLRSVTSVATTSSPPKATPRQGKMPRFASFRDADGNFRFRLFSADGEELLLSMPFADPKAAGALQKRLKTLGAADRIVGHDFGAGWPAGCQHTRLQRRLGTQRRSRATTRGTGSTRGAGMMRRDA